MIAQLQTAAKLHSTKSKLLRPETPIIKSKFLICLVQLDNYNLIKKNWREKDQLF